MTALKITLGFVALFALAAAFAQIPRAPQPGADISAYYRLTPTAAPTYRWLRVDAPLAIELDAAGAPHLKLTQWATFGSCIADADRKLLCTSLSPDKFAYVPVTMRGDVPDLAGDTTQIAGTPTATGWTLHQTPLNERATCFRGHERAIPNVDYALVGNYMRSNVWAATDAIACDYEYAP